MLQGISDDDSGVAYKDVQGNDTKMKGLEVQREQCPRWKILYGCTVFNTSVLNKSAVTVRDFL